MTGWTDGWMGQFIVKTQTMWDVKWRDSEDLDLGISLPPARAGMLKPQSPDDPQAGKWVRQAYTC